MITSPSMTFTRDQTVPLDVDYGLTDDEVRRFLAYGRIPPMMAPGERWRYPDHFIKLNELLARRPVVVVFDMGTRDSAVEKRRWLNKHIDTRAYLTRIESTTQVLVYHRSHWEQLVAPWSDDWRKHYSPYEWCTLEDAAIRLGWTTPTASSRLKEAGARYHVINRYGARVYFKADVEALAIIPWNPGYGRKPPNKQIPYQWYTRAPWTYARELDRHNRNHGARIPSNLLEQKP